MRNTPKTFAKIAALIALLGFSASVHGESQYGSKITLKQPIAMGQAIKDYSEDKKDKVYLVKGYVQKVCQKKGCWLTLADQPELKEKKSNVLQDTSGDIRVLFKNYGYFVPTSLQGKQILAEGNLKRKTLSAENINHFKQDEGKPVDANQKPQVVFQFIASGIKVL